MNTGTRPTRLEMHQACGGCLISRHLNPLLRPLTRYTACILAAESANQECIALLVAAGGVDLNARNMFGKTALIMSAEFGHLPVVASLCAAGADPNIASKRGLSALMLAAVKVRWPAWKCSLETTLPNFQAPQPPAGRGPGAFVSLVRLEMPRPLTSRHPKPPQGHPNVVDIVGCLLKHGADTHFQNPEKTENALSMACVGGKAVVLQLLIDRGARLPDHATVETVLMRACETGNSEIVEILLERFCGGHRVLALLSGQDKDGNTCLMRAGAKGNLKVMLYLIRKLTEQVGRRHTPPSGSLSP